MFSKSAVNASERDCLRGRVGFCRSKQRVLLEIVFKRRPLQMHQKASIDVKGLTHVQQIYNGQR